MNTCLNKAPRGVIKGQKRKNGRVAGHLNRIAALSIYKNYMDWEKVI